MAIFATSYPNGERRDGIPRRYADQRLNEAGGDGSSAAKGRSCIGNI
jgi:hypothetical protein